MDVYRKIIKLRTALGVQRSSGKRIALVATMGNLHEGHLELVRLAKQKADIVVASIFVNPLQFGLNENWEQYPRTFDEDCAKLIAEDCDYLLHPDEREMYPNGMSQQTRVFCATMTDVWCGASRPGHFEGVTTVVTKLLNIVQPDIAVFGEKDWQQLAVIRRMAADLCVNVEIIGAPVARDTDGLALSSRNRFLTKQERIKAKLLYKTMLVMAEAIAGGDRDYLKLQKQASKKLESAEFRLDYLAVVNAKDLEPATNDDKDLRILGAIYASNTRLIDNIGVQPA
ncbi:MAG: pantoate--beta-alanine ligase [Proteobacteria bacterium]|nr:pantoate--beta-alanine ligase [Pseudomonadota bacterium]